MEPYKRFDVLTRSPLEKYPLDWLTVFRLDPGEGVQVVNSDLSTVTAEADKVLLIEVPERWILHVEVQSSYQKALPQRVLRYNVMLSVRHEVPVHSVIVLLFPDADGPALSGRYEQASPDGRCRIAFDYQVVRAWQEPLELLIAGLGTIPLAGLTVTSEDEAMALVERVEDEFKRHPARDEGEIWTALLFLIGGHFQSKELVERILKRIQAMRDNVAYQVILEEGRKEGRQEGRQEGQINLAREMLLNLGADKFQPPSEEIQQRILSMNDLSRLSHLARRVLHTESWQELLDEDESQGN